MKREIINAIEKESRRARTFPKYVWETMQPQDRAKFDLSVEVNPEVVKAVDSAAYANAVKRAKGFAADGEHTKALQMWQKAQAVSDTAEVKAGIADANAMIELANAANGAPIKENETPVKAADAASVDPSVAAANEAFNAKNYALAIELYETAADQNDEHVKARIAEINKIISPKNAKK
jgi:tetratricopeptide (TPR) repeat protein